MWATAVMSAVSMAGSYTLQRMQGKVMQQVAEANARNLEIQAGQERAAAQHEVARKQLEGKIQLGDTKAQLAGSGFTLSGDATAAKIIGQSVEQQTLSELLVLKQAEQRAQGLEAEARQGRWDGRMRRKGANMQATVDLIKNGSDWFNNYGSGIAKQFGSG